MACNLYAIAEGKIARDHAEKYLPFVYKWAKHYDIDPHLIMALIRGESNWNDAAVSKDNAQGLMQLLPSTGEEVAKNIGIKYEPFDPETNIRMGTYLVNELMLRFEKWDLVLGAYYCGSGSVKKALAKYDRMYNVCRIYADKILGRYQAARGACGLLAFNPPLSAGANPSFPHSPLKPSGPAGPSTPPTGPGTKEPPKQPAATDPLMMMALVGLVLWGGTQA